MYKENSALNNLQWLICHKTKPNKSKPIYNINLLSCLLRCGTRPSEYGTQGDSNSKVCLSILLTTPPGQQ